MSFKFHAEHDPCKELCAEVAAFAPANPFYTSSYIEAQRTLGYRPWVLSLQENGRLVSACTAFMKSGYLNRSLEIPSLPTLPDGGVFWEGLLSFCRKVRVSYLVVNSFASASAAIPPLRGETARRTRCAYVLELKKPGLWAQLSSNHKRNIKRGQKAGLQVRRAVDGKACQEHARLVRESMERRKARGEVVPQDVQTQSFAAMTRSGAGELFQAVLDGHVVSSILVLLTDKGGYYQSAGTSTQGMACGASHFLVYEIANALRAQSMGMFNLGGADPHNPGLERFKAEFGAATVGLESAEYLLGNRFLKKLGTAVGLLRSSPMRFFRRLLGRVERFAVYAANPSGMAPPEPRDGVRSEKLSKEFVMSLLTRRDEFGEHAERFRKLGFNCAYGVFVGGKLVHLSALVSVEQDRLLPVRHVKLKGGEAEITHLLTLSEFRGQWLYRYAVLNLCQVARDYGIQRVFMITNINNTSIQKCIERMGFARQGKIVRLVFPYLGEAGLTYRGHRLCLRS